MVQLLIILKKLLLLMTATLVPGSYGANIVGFPMNAYSHTTNLIRIGDELHVRGHNYTLLISTWVLGKLKSTDLPVKLMTYPSYLNDTLMNFCIESAVRKWYSPPTNCSSTYSYECTMIATNPEIIKSIADADILICDVINLCCYVMAKIARVPLVIDYSPVGMFDPVISNLHRIPNSLAYVPQVFADYTNKMTFIERFKNVIIYLIAMTSIKVAVSPFNQILLKHGIAETVYTDRSPAAMVLIATDFCFEFPRPITPAVKVIGPVLPHPPKLLPKELKAIIDVGNDGFVFVSFGTAVIALSQLIDVYAVAKGLEQVPYQVLWKYNGPLTNISDNIQLVQWAPQNDLLGHPKIKAFVSHCGTNSVNEAAYHGVPILAIPLFGDQFSNAQKVAAASMGKVIDAHALDANVIAQSIIDVATNKTYQKNAKKVSSIMQYRPSGRSPVQEAADWIEYALRFDGGQHLLSEEFNMHFYQNYLLDVVTFLLAIMCFSYCCIKIACTYLCKCCCIGKRKQD